MSGHDELIHRFYEAFARRDAETMAACYADDASFSDPVFVDLRGRDVGDMWRMLCARGKDLQVVHSAVTSHGDAGTAHWEADYTFSTTGRKVHNVIDARFEFRDGKIVEHVDRFDLYRWTRMALGVPGVVLGWAPPFQNTLRRKALEGLRAWQSKPQA